ncbi:MAG: diadenylate cyclase CdaA [Clostridia bacterium]|nr:diadenylate cyclase CdaA [Clostridia bacterium]
MSILKDILNFFTKIDVFDVIDICLVWFFLYLAYKFIRERRASKLAIGVGVLLALRVISDFYELVAMRFILQNVLQVGLIALVVVFQPELRSALEKVGGEPFRGIKSLTDAKDSALYGDVIDNLCEAICDMSLDKTGALIVIERETKLGDYAKTGTLINADVSSFLIKNIFFNKAPLHDGAVIIRNARVHAAGCFLPLSTNPDIIKDLGTRHRAAIGMSENSDAAVIVVSEENGVISIAHDGKLKRNYDYAKLHKELTQLMLEGEENGRGIRQRFRMAKKKDASEKNDGGKDETV